MAFSFGSKGDWRKTKKFLDAAAKDTHIRTTLNRASNLGIQALAASAPKRSGLTASSFSSKIEVSSAGVKITWLNTNQNNGVNIALIYQYGHGTGTGGYVQGADYINPAMKPTFDAIADMVWKEMQSL